jgi:hypothetical protein
LTRLPALVLALLVAATVAAFFVTQHLKVTTPLLAGSPAPDPSVIDPVSGGNCGGNQRRVTRVSFYLLHRSDDVDVYVIDQSGNVVDTVASGRHMRRGVRNPDGDFSWDGRLADGRLAPDGTYYFQVSLIHQGRTVVISNAAGPEPITVESTPPRPRVTSISPQVIPHGGRASASIRYSGNGERGGYVNLYRTDLPGRPRLVKTFGLPWGGHSLAWDGRIRGRPAPAGTYLVGLILTDGACVTARSPAPRATPHAGITVSYLAAEPPLDPVPAGSRPLVRIQSGRGSYSWSLRIAGARKTIATGTAAGAQLSVPLPAGRPGLYELSLRSRPYATSVPIVARAPRPQRVLVVLPALTWQGLNPVDDDGDGMPNTLSGEAPVVLARPFARGLPSGFSDEAGFLAYLDSTRRAYDLTTDLGLIGGRGARLGGHALIVLAGSEQWVPGSLGRALRSYVAGGGRVLSLGIGSLLRGVTVRDGRALDPTPPARTDALGATPKRLVTGNRSPVRATRDDLGLFRGAARRLAGFTSLEPFAAPSVLSAAGAAMGQDSIVAYRFGRGVVVDVGLVGLGSRLAHDRTARALVDSVLRRLS